jgi:hypothetical protein
LNAAYHLVNQTGFYHDAIRDWKKKADADKTWANFKTHFLQAQEDLNEEPTTANQAGYYAFANAAAEATMSAAAEALSNLATTNTASTSVLQTLTNQLTALTAKVDQLTTQNGELQRVEDHRPSLEDQQQPHQSQH